MTGLNKHSISKRMVDGLPVDGKSTVYWDRDLPGFGVRVYASGRKTYVVQSRGPNGSRRVTLGRHGKINADKARKEAMAAIDRIKTGEAPLPESAQPEPTVADLAERYLRTHVAVECKPSSEQSYRRSLEHILPALGGMPVGTVEREHVASLHLAMRATPVAANMALWVLSKMFSLAEAWGLRPPGRNPCRTVRRYRTPRRERFLSREEYRRIGRVMNRAEADGTAWPWALAAIRLLMLTGCRSQEVATLRWDDVDFSAEKLRLRDSKNGPRMVPLPPTAVEVLEGVRRIDGNPWVFPGRLKGSHVGKLAGHWHGLRVRADLSDVRLHDLRHSYASRALALGESLSTIGKLLGHSKVETTGRYAHLARDTEKVSAERVAVSIEDDIFPMRRRPTPQHETETGSSVEMAKLKRRTISHRTVESLPATKETVYWDRVLSGFGVRVYPSGSKVYIVQTRKGGRSQRVTVGRHGVVTAAQARDRAALIIARIKSGEAPAAGPKRKKNVPTVAELAERYRQEHLEVRCKPSTASRVRSTVRTHLLPAFGGCPIDAVDADKVWALRNRLHATPAAANNAVNVLSEMLSMAETWGLVPEGSNPCPRVARYKMRRRERFLTQAEFSRLGRVLSEAEAAGEVPSHAAAALRLLMLTGCRRNEILRLRWDEVDLERRELRLRDSKTGPRTVPLSPPAARVLANRPRVDGTPWVIPGGVPGRHVTTIDRAWHKVRARAELEDVRLHDLRHSFASRALALGESLPVIGKLLGHTEVQTTARYSHLAEESVMASAARIAASIGEDILEAPGTARHV